MNFVGQRSVMVDSGREVREGYKPAFFCPGRILVVPESYLVAGSTLE